MLLVAAMMAVMMSMGPAFAHSLGGGGQGGGPNGGDGGGATVQHKHNNFKKHNLCLVRDRWGDLFWVRCVR